MKIEQLIIGNHCWIGCNAVVMKGATIVSAGATVRHKHTSPNYVLAGDEEIKKGVNWHDEFM